MSGPINNEAKNISPRSLLISDSIFTLEGDNIIYNQNTNLIDGVNSDSVE